ncbi:toxin-antitoxin system, toxin component, Fic family [Desulfitobacterium hafniense DP7]|uniref:Toxin-antitoxin system, toxin component, Fic family n=1 Tax=Desulfitobacterium hafniense DP7 TaxID=537010 RepID=G9XVY7_DESHA|nr:Fic family protein [Desulfitobacterium hafniense]EHL04250.1 toxin-antitoxin system, toxin component, Fic family [Desulfitobacterium hafniense DP7]
MGSMKNRAGEYRTNLTGELQYRSFLPYPLPPSPPIELDEETIKLLTKANRSIGILEGMSRQIPDIDLFVSMYVRKEALLSSQIEGTQATLDDILDPNIEENTNQNVADVINYIKASQYGSARLAELPLCNRLLKEIHEILMQDVRGGEKSPGEFRSSQNWIGPAGSTLRDARYIPPHPEDMLEAMSDLEKFINSEDELDPLIKIALIHYQFETIHPFLDGNGRIGRLLIALYLINQNLLSHETLYISYFLKRNRIEYYDRLTEVRTKGNFEQWLKFFLLAAYESAQDAIDTIERIIKLHYKNVEVVKNTGKASKTVMKVFNYLESSPIIDIKKTSLALELSFNTVSNAVNKLVELGILKQTENVRRSRVFAYEEYLEILRKDT